MKRILTFAFIGLTLLACSNKNLSCGTAYFGGEIINPNNDHLILYDSNVPIDTVYLDANNRFSYKLENLNPGLYSFVHGGEYQVVLIEPNDSIMIRLNTYDFDESLVFSGKGAKKNNFLIGMFIRIEKDNRPMYEMGKKLEPEAFVSVLDSMRNMRQEKLESFKAKYAMSPLFAKVSKACIDYDYYAHKEIYPFRYFGNKYVSHDMLPDGYFDFRNEIDYDEEELKDFYPYYNFLFPHFNNLAMSHYIGKTKDTLFNRNSVHYHMSKLRLIDSLIANESVKNNLLKYSTRNFLSKSTSEKERDVVYTSFMQKCSNSEYSEYISDFYGTLKSLQPGQIVPNLKLVDSRNTLIGLHDLPDKPTVLYFWTKANRMHASDSHSKVYELRDQYPEMNFVSVNVNAQRFSSWRRMLDQYKFDSRHEFMLKDPVRAVKDMALYSVYRVVLLDADKNIVHPNLNLFRSELEDYLQKVTQQQSF